MRSRALEHEGQGNVEGGATVTLLVWETLWRDDWP
jgi:hypothetical protein